MGCYSSKTKCVICYNEAEKLLWPCGHFCLCSDCSIELSKYRQGPKYLNVNLNLDDCKGVKCPICRSTSVPTNVYF